MDNLVSFDIVKTVQSVKVTRRQSNEVCVQRQLTGWLEPGWCMTPPTGSESKANRKRKLMLWWIVGLLLVTSYPMEGVISIALVLVIVLALVGLIRGKMPPYRKEGII